MRLTRESIIAWGSVFRITFPNGKIYVGSGTARNAKQDFSNSSAHLLKKKVKC